LNSSWEGEWLKKDIDLKLIVIRITQVLFFLLQQSSRVSMKRRVSNYLLDQVVGIMDMIMIMYVTTRIEYCRKMKGPRLKESLRFSVAQFVVLLESYHSL